MKLIDHMKKELTKNWFVCGPGGFGKTTGLLHIVKTMTGARISAEGRTVTLIPVFVRLAELNVHRVDSLVLYQYLMDAFANNSVTKKAINDMLDAYANSFHVLFLLDGINEVYDLETPDGQTVMTHLRNNVRELVCHGVSFIITGRGRAGDYLDPNLAEAFQELRLLPLNGEKIVRAVEAEGFDAAAVSDSLRELLSVPLMLSVFKEVYQADPEAAVHITNKYELLRLYFEIEGTALRRDPRWDDAQLKIREFAMKNLLPRIAFLAERQLLAAEETFDCYSYDEMVEIALRPWMAGLSCRQAYQIRSMLENVQYVRDVNGEAVFSHDLYREFLSLQRWCSLLEEHESEQAVSFLEHLIKQLAFKEKKDLPRRTRHIDLAELIYVYAGSDLENGVAHRIRESEERKLHLLLCHKVSNG